MRESHDTHGDGVKPTITDAKLRGVLTEGGIDVAHFWTHGAESWMPDDTRKSDVKVGLIGLERVKSALDVLARAPLASIDFASEPRLRESAGVPPNQARATAMARMLMLGGGSFDANTHIVAMCVAMLDVAFKHDRVSYLMSYEDLCVADATVAAGADASHINAIEAYAARESELAVDWDTVMRTIATDASHGVPARMPTMYRQARTAVITLSNVWGREYPLRPDIDYASALKKEIARTRVLDDLNEGTH